MSIHFFDVALLGALIFTGWWLYFVEYAQLRIDATRQELFRIRDELFVAASEADKLNSDAYLQFRETINGAIRFTHKLSVIRVIGLVRADTVSLHGSLGAEYQETLLTNLSKLPADFRQVVMEARAEMHVTVAKHLVKSSAIVLVLGSSVAICIVAWQRLLALGKNRAPGGGDPVHRLVARNTRWRSFDSGVQRYRESGSETVFA